MSELQPSGSLPQKEGAAPSGKVPKFSKQKPHFSKFAKKPVGNDAEEDTPAQEPKPVVLKPIETLTPQPKEQTEQPMEHDTPAIEESIKSDPDIPPQQPKASEGSDADQAIIRFTDQFDQIRQTFEDSINKSESKRSVLKSLIDQENEAIENLNFQSAEAISGQIIATRGEIAEIEKSLFQIIEDAMLLANNSPIHLQSHSIQAKSQLPSLESKRRSLEDDLKGLEANQEADRIRFEHLKENAAQLALPIRKSIEENKAKCEIKEKAHKEKLLVVESAFKTRIQSLADRKAEHEAKISELQAEIESRKKEIVDLNVRIADEQKAMKKQQDLIKSEVNFAKAENNSLQALQKQMDEIEAPQKKLMENISKRNEMIEQKTDEVDRTAKAISDTEFIESEGEKMASTILEICESFSNLSRECSQLRKTCDTLTEELNDKRSKKSALTNEMAKLKVRAGQESDLLAECRQRLSALTASKEKAVSEKKFKEAQLISVQINEVSELVTSCEASQTKSEDRMADAKAEMKAVGCEKCEEELRKARDDFREKYLGFFKETEDKLASMFEKSDFVLKMLSPLQKILHFGSDHSMGEKPKMTKQEIEEKIADLESQIEKCVAEESYDKAANLQDRVNSLQAEIENNCK